MKTFFKTYLLLVAFSLFMVACNDDEPEATNQVVPAAPQPSITNIQAAGHDGGATTIARGETLSVDFDARTQSDAFLDKYHIEIHDHPATGLIEDEYKIIDSTFVNDPTFENTRNAHVHKHIVIPDTANLGAYHVVVIVFDKDGNTTDTEDLEMHIEVVE